MMKSGIKKSTILFLSFLICFTPSFFQINNKREIASAYPWIAFTLKEGYLILVLKEADKALYQNYIQERTEKYDVHIVSLEERNISNDAKKIKLLINDIYTKFFFRYVVLDENIAYGTRKIASWADYKNQIIQYEKPYISDIYYSFNNPYLDESIPERKPAFFIGRITHHFLAQSWQTQYEQKALLALPFDTFAHRSVICKSCIVDPVDYAYLGEQLKSMLGYLNIHTVSMYEKRGAKPSKFYCDIPLNAVNFEKELVDSTILFSACTSEPIVFKRYEYDEDYTPYRELITSYWDDKNNDKVVDDKSKELTFEKFYPCNNPMPAIKRIGFLMSHDKPDGLDSFYCSISSIEDLNKTDAYLYSDNYLWIFQSLILGSSIGEAMYYYSFNSEKKYWTGLSFYTSTPYILFGPPETTIHDLVQTVKKPSKEKDNYLILVKEGEDKDLFESYIQERIEKYNIQVVSLEEKKVDCTPGKVKNLINELYTAKPFKFLVLYENIPYGTVYRYESNLTSDMFYLLNNPKTDLYEDPIDKSLLLNKVFISRISKDFLQKEWIPSFNYKAALAMPIEYYPRHYEEEEYNEYVEYKTDYAFNGNWLENFLYTKGIESTTLYEKRGDFPSRFESDLSLSKENVISEIKNSAVIYMTTTSEPGSCPLFYRGQVFKKAEPKITTSFWTDKDKDGFVDQKNTELEYEELFTFTEEVGIQKKIVFCPLKTKPENPGIFYNMITTTESLKEKQYITNLNGWCLNEVFRNLFLGCSISESFQLDLASGNKNLKIAFILWGPPETTIVDLFH